MNAQDFCYWLKGFSELSGAQPTQEQWQSIKEHLDTVFVKVTPPVKANLQQSDADALHALFEKAAKEKRKFNPYELPKPNYFLHPRLKAGDLIC